MVFLEKLENLATDIFVVEHMNPFENMLSILFFESFAQSPRKNGSTE